MPPIIHTSNLGKAYPLFAKPHHRLLHSFAPSVFPQPQHWALRNLTLSVQPRETLGIIGRNGSGKSTLLQLLAQTLTPTEGSLHITGKVAALLELGAGFNPDFTGRENVTLNAHLLGLSRSQITDRFPLIAAFADIGDYLDRPVKTYSSGMVLRLAFAVIAHVDADILIIDEALSVGDAFFTQKCIRFLRTFKSTGTLLFVSHDSSAVINLCDHALWLENGLPKSLGPAKIVCEQYLATLVQDAAPPISASTPPSPEIAIPGPNAFGQGGATLTQVLLLNQSHQPLTSTTGNEPVTLHIHAAASTPIAQPLIGFFIKDRLGQSLFGDNTAAACPNPAPLRPGESCHAAFSFQMPTLPPGNYTIAAAIADGSQSQHKMLHWIHDSALFTSINPTHHQGLVGIPMQNIQLKSGADAPVGMPPPSKLSY